jgi:flagellum-specific peptidoglycan hydrolase FlgJ
VKAARKARWQQATALVSLSTAGAMTGFSFAHGSVADLTSPTGVPVKLMAADGPAGSATASDNALRAAIVKAARYYLRLAQNRSPSEMESLIWQGDSLNGADHGESCAAFASLTLESGAQATGQQSWVTGGSTYPWPVHSWVDSRVDPNPDSPGITSILQDAEAHSRWQPIGDGYTPQPGDWVLFDGHVEVVTKYASGVLYTIGGDSMPNLSVNAHQYDGSLAAQGVTGFVNNGTLLSTVSQTGGGGGGQGGSGSGPASGAHRPAQRRGSAQDRGTAQGQAGPGQSGLGQSGLGQADPGQADIPGMVMPALAVGDAASGAGQAQNAQAATVAPGSSAATATPGVAAAPAAAGAPAGTGALAGTAMTAKATIPGAMAITGSVTSYSPAAASPRYSRSTAVPSTESVPDTSVQQAFINEVAPGALAAQQQYGIPAAVTIAQAIDESGWGQSLLAAQDNNLFGIKGTGPAGSVTVPTEEYENGQPVTISAPFRVYSDVAQSINDHTLLLATGSAYQQAMADRRSPDAFANDLTGVYATDPTYGTTLITIMRQYNLYRFDAGTSAKGTATASGTAQNGAAQNGAAQNGTARSGTARSGTADGGNGSALVGAPGAALAGTAGHSAAIPGVVQVNAAALGMAAERSGGASVAGRGASGAVQAVAGSGRAVAGSGRVGQAVGSGSGAGTEGSGGASIPGIDDYAGTGAASVPAQASTMAYVRPIGAQALRAGPRNMRVSTRRYVTEMPRVVTTDFITTAKIPLLRAKPVYQEVADGAGIRWELLAACDWMQCQAQPGMSPVYGEKLGVKNPDGTAYRTKADALDQCAADLIELAAAVYGINLRQRLLLSVRDLANVFAAFRWGGLLKAHRISAMEFPYSVEGLTAAHVKMRWPSIGDEAPDKPGTRFRMSFGAVPVVLRLNYPAIA